MQELEGEFAATSDPVCGRMTVTIGRVCDFPPGSSATVELRAGRELAFFNIAGEFFAIDNCCPHKGAPLVEGIIDGHIVECGLHGWQFDLKSGRCLNNVGAVETFEVRVENGEIRVVF